MTSGPSRSEKLANRWPTVRPPPRSSERQPTNTPPVNTGVSSVVATLPMIGMNAIITSSTTKITVIAIHGPGAATNRRQPSAHQAVPWPEGTAAGAREGAAEPAGVSSSMRDVQTVMIDGATVPRSRSSAVGMPGRSAREARSAALRISSPSSIRRARTPRRPHAALRAHRGEGTR